MMCLKLLFKICKKQSNSTEMKIDNGYELSQGRQELPSLASSSFFMINTSYFIIFYMCYMGFPHILLHVLK